MSHQDENHKVLEKVLNFINVNPSFSRREFLLISGVTVVGISALGAKAGKKTPLIIIDQAEGIVIADPTKCVGCRRCELACTEFNDGKAAPSMARIKVARNANFGPKGVYAGQRGQGNWGNGFDRPGLLQAVSSSRSLCHCLSQRCHCHGAQDKSQDGGFEEMCRLPDMSEGLPLGDDVFRPGYEQGHQMLPLQWKTEVRGGLSRRRPDLRGLDGPDR